jgi:hypothetical protein
LKMCLRTAFVELSPEGTAESSPGRSPGWAECELRHLGSEGGTQDCRPGCFQPSLRDWFVLTDSTQDCVLGYAQPSLRD